MPHVADILKTKGGAVVTVRATAPLAEAIALLDRERIGAVPVLNEAGQLVGMLSERDLVGVLAEYGDRAFAANVGALMSRRVYVCTPQDRLDEVLAWMVHRRVRHLPVVEDGRLRGLISIGDAAKHLVGEAETEPPVLSGVILAGP